MKKTTFMILFLAICVWAITANPLIAFASEEDFNIENAEMLYFRSSISPTENNVQNIEIVLNGKTLTEGTDYIIWYQNNMYIGTAKMLVIGIGDYTGYIEKEYEIEEDTITISHGSDAYIRTNDSFVLKHEFDNNESFKQLHALWGQGEDMYLDKSEIEEWYDGYSEEDGYDVESLVDGSFLVTYCGETGIHFYKLVTEQVYTGWRWSGTRLVQYKEIKSKEYLTSILQYGADVRLVEVDQISPSGRETIFLKPKITPIYAENQELVWTSSDDNIATVDDFGVVTLNQAGQAKIFATAHNGEKMTAELNIEPLKISSAAVKSIAKLDDSSYSIVLEDKYGDLREGKDYTITQEVENDTLVLKISGINLYSGHMVIKYDINNISVSSPSSRYVIGDLTGNDDIITDSDAIYLMYHTFFQEDYPLNQPCDFNNDGVVTDEDSIYLMYHTFFPDEYPLVKW